MGLAYLNSEITRQAAAISYLNDFRMMMVMTALIVPLAYLMRNPTLTPEDMEEAAQHAVMD
jgi:DHA2 family multidrug resistance protein